MLNELRVLKILSAGLLASVFAGPVFAADVTPERLLNADKEPQNWLMPHKEYNSHRYSGLTEITKDNVKNLKVAFTTAIGGVPGAGNNPTGGLQATPIVNDGLTPGGRFTRSTFGMGKKAELSG
jgi:alcohol dehydrogenase (cytochrome c)